MIEISGELEAQLRRTADAEGLLAESTTRRAQLSAFRTAIAERLASLKADESEDGEEVMTRLISELG